MDESRAVELLKKMLQAHESEIDCETCGDQMECLAELTIAGAEPGSALEAIQRHISCCRCCRTEFEALLSMLRMAQAEG